MLRLSRSQELLSSFSSICKHFSRSLVNKVETMSENVENDVSETLKRPLEEEVDADTKKQKIEEVKKIKKKNYAMLLGYLGKDYYGMQRNPGMNTIEEHLIKALFAAELINSESFETIQNINFQRAARTDKGVSAVRQVVSLKLPENPCKDSINKSLPDDIRVFGLKRVTRGFNSKSQCDARTYSYTMPTFTLAPENLELFQETAEFHDVEKRMEQLSVIDGKPYTEYRLPSESKQRLSDILKFYEGTRNFHNFTSKILPLDPRAKRYIMSFVAEEPYLVDGVEFITLKVKGQSFVLHQIRKMVSMAIGVMRNVVSKEAFEQTVYEPQKFDISRAPSLGLMLNIVHYDYYNKRYGSDGMHETLDWLDCEEEVKEFEKNKIVKHVIETELKEKSMLDWLANLGVRSYGPRDENRDKNNDDAQEENTSED